MDASQCSTLLRRPGANVLARAEIEDTDCDDERNKHCNSGETTSSFLTLSSDNSTTNDRVDDDEDEDEDCYDDDGDDEECGDDFEEDANDEDEHKCDRKSGKVASSSKHRARHPTGQKLSTNSTTTTTNSSATKKAQKPRRRVATLAQRRAANIRERRRMFNLNSAFDRLRKEVPSFAYEKRLSRIETLKLAIMYIRFMDDLVNDDDYAEKYKQLTANTSLATASSGFMTPSTYLALHGPTQVRSSSSLSSSSTTAAATATAEHLHRSSEAYSTNPAHNNGRGSSQNHSSLLLTSFKAADAYNRITGSSQQQQQQQQPTGRHQTQCNQSIGAVANATRSPSVALSPPSTPSSMSSVVSVPAPAPAPSSMQPTTVYYNAPTDHWPLKPLNGTSGNGLYDTCTTPAIRATTGPTIYYAQDQFACKTTPHAQRTSIDTAQAANSEHQTETTATMTTTTTTTLHARMNSNTRQAYTDRNRMHTMSIVQEPARDDLYDDQRAHSSSYASLGARVAQLEDPLHLYGGPHNSLATASSASLRQAADPIAMAQQQQQQQPTHSAPAPTSCYSLCSLEAR